MTRRSESRARWQQVADGELENDLQEWLRDTARALLAADDLPAKKRRDGIVKALGLQYRQNPHAHVADTVNVMLSFSIIGENGQARAPRHGEKTRAMIAAARHADPSWEDLTEDKVRKRLDRLRRDGMF